MEILQLATITANGFNQALLQTRVVLYNRVIYSIPIELATVSTLDPFQGQGCQTFGKTVCVSSCVVAALKKKTSWCGTCLCLFFT